jgi:hypothetical protein
MGSLFVLKELSIEELGSTSLDKIMDLQTSIIEEFSRSYLKDRYDIKALMGLTKPYVNVCNVDLFKTYSKTLGQGALKSGDQNEQIFEFINMLTSELDFI